MIVTDNHIARLLTNQQVDISDVEFLEDYTVGHPSTKIYRNNKTGLYMASCQALPKVNPDGIRICGDEPNLTMVGWVLSGGKHLAKPNVFTCSVDSLAIELVSLGSRFTARGQSVGWEPRVYLNGVEQHCGSPTVLLIDSTNPNYHNNVIEWDYGICKRRLRQIEGFISDHKIVYSNPHGEVRVKLNQSGDLKLSLSAAIDAEGNPLGRVEGDEEIVSAEEFNKVVYPVTIGASLPVYSTSSDGYNRILTQATWDAAYTAANANNSDAVGDIIKIQTYRVAADNWNCGRGYLYFDPSAAAGGTVTGVVAGFYGESLDEHDAGHADLGVVEGLQSDPFDNADYGDHRTQDTLLHADYHDVSASWHLDDYNDITFNAGGITVVQTAIDAPANVKLCTRVRGDITDTDPTSANLLRFWSNEKGAGKLPRLVITYTPAVTFIPTVTIL